MANVYVNDVFAPNCVLVVNDMELDDALMTQISDITYEDEGDGSSSLSFSVSYQSNVLGGISTDLLNTKVFSPGNLIALRGGYGTELQDIGAGYVTDIEPNFHADQSPTFRVVCYDQLHRLSLEKSETGRSWISTWRDSQIATFVGSESGFIIAQTDTASVAGVRKTRSRYGEQPRIQKRGEANYSFMRELADQNGFELCCKWDGKAKKFRLFFEPPRDQLAPVFIFEYGTNIPYHMAPDENGVYVGTLTSFQPRFSVTSQFTKYRAYSTNPQGQPIAHTMTLDEFIDEKDTKLGGIFADTLIQLSSGKTIGGAESTQNAFGEILDIISTKVFDNRQQANEYLKIHMRKLARDFMSGPAVIKGNQFIQSRQVHEFRGLGPLFDGKYYVKSCKHQFNRDGYETTMEVRKTTPEEKTR